MFINQNGTTDVQNLRILKMGWNRSASKTNCKCSFLDNRFFCFRSHVFVKFILCKITFGWWVEVVRDLQRKELVKRLTFVFEGDRGENEAKENRVSTEFERCATVAGQIHVYSIQWTAL